MRIATLQFSSKLGETSSNIAHANHRLSQSPPNAIDLLVLPELAFTGYNHTLASILPHLEPTAAGPSTTWAKTTAAKHNCIVTVGYPERFTPPNFTKESVIGDEVIAYNSTVTVSPAGEVLAHYRKTHLYYTDETWAKEGPEGWLVQDLPLCHHQDLQHPRRDNATTENVKAAFGICMDLNPRAFLAPWSAYEFCVSAINAGATLLILSMAWLTSLPAAELRACPEKPDMATFSYWIQRLRPLVEGEGGYGGEEGESEDG